MSFLEIMTMALALGTDAFSVAVVVGGVQQYQLLTTARISLIIGFFHIVMPLIGLYGGIFLRQTIAHFGLVASGLDMIFNTVGSGLLLLIGFYMIGEAWLGEENKLADFKVRGWGIMTLAFSVSLDSLSVGIGLGMMDFQVVGVFIFGIMAALMMGMGLMIGSQLGNWLGDGAQIWGGLALIYLGFHFLGYI